MTVRIRRKFLVDRSYAEQIVSQASDVFTVMQGYLSTQPNHRICIQLIRDGGGHQRAFITIAGQTINNMTSCFSYEVPIADGQSMFLMSDVFLPEKKRFVVDYRGSEWIVDQHRGPNDGLMVAKVEQASLTSHIDIPPWVGLEVTNDTNYTGAKIANVKVPV